MHQNPPVATHATATLLDRAINGLSVFTLALTVPQAVNVWTGAHGQGVSLWSWGAYLLSAVIWMIYGLRKHDRHIYLPCIGWIVLDAAIVIGLLVNG